jgi:hypothetical protein
MLRNLVLAGFVAAVSLQGAQPAAATYDAKFTTAEGQLYTGTTTFAVDAKGAVTGKMRLIDPAEVTGTLAGTVKDGTWTFEYPYEIPAQMCSGTVKGTAKVSADRKLIEGKGVAGGACTNDQPLDLTFTLTLQAK